MFLLRRQYDLEEHVKTTMFLLLMSFLDPLPFPSQSLTPSPHFTSGVVFFASLRFLLKINIYLKLSLLFCPLYPGAHTFIVGFSSANQSTLRGSRPSLFFVDLLYYFFVHCLKPLLPDVLFSLFLRVVAKVAEGAHI